MKTSAQQRADRIAAFRAELAELERAQVLALSPEQRDRIEAHLEEVLAGLAREHGVDLTEGAKRVSWGMRLVALLGGVAFLAALVLFLHRVWGFLPTWGQVGVLAGVPLCLLGATELAARRGLHPYYLGLLAFATGTTFVLQLNALGGILNLAPSPHALLAWAAFGVLLAYACGARLLLGCGLVLACAYGAAWWTARTGAYWGEMFRHAEGFIPVAAAGYVLPWLVPAERARGFDTVYRVWGAGVALTALLVLSKAGHLCCGVIPAQSVELIYQMLGLGLSAGVIWHGLRLGWGSLVNVGAVGFVVFLVVRLHAWWWDWMPKYLFCLVIGCIAVLLLVVFRRIRGRLGAGQGCVTGTEWDRESGGDRPVESGLGLAGTHHGDEPGNRPLTRPPGTLSRPTGEGWGEGSGTLARPTGEGWGEGSSTLARPTGEGRGEGRLTVSTVPVPRAMLLAAAALVLLVADTWALVSVWRNRGAPLGGTVELTERELEPPFLIGDSTVLALDVRWEARSSDPHTERFPDWLEATKLAELGFDCRVPLTSPAARRHYNSQSARPLFVVLELAQESLLRPGRSAGQGTRLIAVDGGLEAQDLRRQYPDEARFVIARTVAGVSFERHDRDGRVLPEPRLQGWLGPLLPSTIFVPKPWCGLLQRLRRSDNTPEGALEGGPRFAAKVAWGAHFEPWVRDVRLLPGRGAR